MPHSKVFSSSDHMHYGSALLPTVKHGEAMKSDKERMRELEEIIDIISEKLFEHSSPVGGTHELYLKFDGDLKGWMSFNDFKRVMYNFGVPLQDSTVSTLLLPYDDSGQGRINYHNFTFLVEDFSEHRLKRRHFLHGNEAQTKSEEKSVSYADSKAEYATPEEPGYVVKDGSVEVENVMQRVDCQNKEEKQVENEEQRVEEEIKTSTLDNGHEQQQQGEDNEGGMSRENKSGDEEAGQEEELLKKLSLGDKCPTEIPCTPEKQHGLRQHSYAHSSFSNVFFDRSGMTIAEEKEAILDLLYNKLCVEHDMSKHDLFLYFDEMRDGKVSAMELQHAFNRMGLPLKRHQVEWVMAEFDTDHNGSIDFHGFIQMLRHLRSDNESYSTGLTWDFGSDGRVVKKNQMQMANLEESRHSNTPRKQHLDKFNLDPLNGATVDDFREAARYIAKDILQREQDHDESVKEFFKTLDRDNNGVLDICEFKDGLETLGYYVSNDAAIGIFSIFDLSRDRKIHYWEFIRGLHELSNIESPMAVPNAAEKVADRDSFVESTYHSGKKHFPEYDYDSVYPPLNLNMGLSAPLRPSAPLCSDYSSGSTMKPDLEKQQSQSSKNQDRNQPLKKQPMLKNESDKVASGTKSYSCKETNDDDEFLAEVDRVISEKHLSPHTLIRTLVPEKKQGLDADGLRQLMEKLGFEVSDNRLDRLMSRADISKNGKIESWELVRLLSGAHE